MIRQSITSRQVYNLRIIFPRSRFSSFSSVNLKSTKNARIRAKENRRNGDDKSNENRSELFRKTIDTLFSERRYRYSIEWFSDLYKSNNRLFIEDVVSFAGSHSHIRSKVFDCFSKSHSMRSLILHELTKLCINGGHKSVLTVFGWMEEIGLLSKLNENEFKRLRSNFKDLNDDQKTEKIGNLIVKHAIYMGDPLMVASIALELISRNIKLTADSVSSLFKVLTVDKNLHFTYKSYAILKVMEAIPPEYHAHLNKIEILEYLLSDSQYLYFANLFYDLYIRGHLELESNWNDTTYKLIKYNLMLGNLDRVYSLFVATISANTAIPERMEVTVLLLKQLAEKDENKLSEFIAKFLSKEMYASDMVVDTLLEILGTRPQYLSEFGELIKFLQTPLRRRTLSSLFAAFVHQNNELGAEKILKHISDSRSGLNSHDINVIVERLLMRSDVTECIKILQRNNIIDSKFSYITLLKFLLPMPDIAAKNTAVTILVREFKKLSKSDKVYQALTTEVIRYISRNINNRAARALYSYLDGNKSFLASSRWTKHHTSISKYRVPQALSPLLYIGDHNKANCIEIILLQSIIDEDEQILEWAIDELRLMGLTIKDIAYKIPGTPFVSEVLSDEILQLLRK